MAEIKINQLGSIHSDEAVIDLKTESHKGNEEAVTAFKSLRGGHCPCRWVRQ
jgi:hypothetical protein